ncbi:hypothetical protein [Actinoallomurus iriomotensis]|uniref:Uncharacterized protein n=1 Tax=Actinoallomurus iriomotensis TaxID=478107 RepID=A0A9W6RTE5_9ACTN|nr:hypothetical protein [Actinoallomurus iriomotensis]GLY82226.1 hypothetical protein Airi02_001580 [Actinoallomurus iriomotensis]
MTEPEETVPYESDLELLRRYEPVLSYTDGERFFPVAVEDYLACCGLWRGEEQLVPAGELTAEVLVATAERYPESQLSLLLVQEPFHRKEVRRYTRAKPPIAKSGRLAAVGLFGRVFDVLLRASLFLRGSVPGGVAAAAADLYERRMNPARCTYYGRVVREGGYVALQYYFLYAMNDWRTTFSGVNDHEADWEAVTVYLAESPSGPRPAWVAVSAHDESGDDLRRRWDDPDLRLAGEHPVIYVGAGSHSGAFVRGRYLVTVNPARLRPILRGTRRVTAFAFPWTREGRRHSGVGIPFIDYALGDGEEVGPSRARGWHPVVISDETPWVSGFHGLWGRDTRDWVGGERAPAGPRYDRDGRVRTLWADPLGWAGLQKVPPEPEDDVRALRDRIAILDKEIADADATIEQDREELRRLRAAAVSLGRHENARGLARQRSAEVVKAENALRALVRTRTDLAEERAAHDATLARPPAVGRPQEHLREPNVPYTPTRGSRTRFLNVWAALSTPLFILAVVGVFVVPHEPVSILLAGVVFLFLTMEAWARRRMLALATGLLMLAGAVAVVVGLSFAVVYGGRYVLLGPMVVVAAVLLVVNLRELFRS